MREVVLDEDVYEVFVTMPRVVRRPVFGLLLSTLHKALDGAIAPPVSFYHRTATNSVVMGIRLSITRAAAVLPAILRAAAQAGVGVVEPKALPPAARRPFYAELHPIRAMEFQAVPSFEEALRALGADATSKVRASRPPLEGGIEVRFRRGDQWQRGYLRSISVGAIDIATDCAPRQGDTTDLMVWVSGRQFATQVTVVRVTERHVADGVGSFGACFVHRDKTVGELVQGIAACGLVPPSSRRDVRYPVHWPVSLWQDGVWAAVSASDVSRRGLFVASETALAQGAPVHIGLHLDDGGAAIASEARVARVVSQETARTRGIDPGFGVEFTKLPALEQGRFLEFLERIARRVGHHVVVGSAADRLSPLLTELIGAGYVASGATDLASVVSKAKTCRPDLVVIDDALYDDNPSAVDVVAEALGKSKVRMIRLHGEAMAEVRARVDQTLLR
jgi:hypothetical protein